MNFLEDLFKKDSLLARIISLVVACFLWAYVMMEQNPVVERYYEVPLVQKNIAQNMEVFNDNRTTDNTHSLYSYAAIHLWCIYPHTIQVWGIVSFIVVTGLSTTFT